MPPYGACAGCKFFFDISKSDLLSCHNAVEGLGKCGWVWYLIWELLLQSYEFWKKCSGRKPISDWDFWNFSLPFFSPHYAEFTGEIFFWYLKVEYVISVGWPSPSIIKTVNLRSLWEILFVVSGCSTSFHNRSPFFHSMCMCCPHFWQNNFCMFFKDIFQKQGNL